MKDTQWPRYEVFQQDREGRPHQNIGTVHAPDAEMALQNARDVFARRPQTLSFWVVPVDAILMKSDQELAREGLGTAVATGAPAEKYYVFQKQSQRRAMAYVVHTGEVEAASPEEALQKAIAQFGGKKKTYIWWIVPADVIYRSEDEDIDSMFAPADTKSYRMPREYRTVSQMMEIRRDIEE